MREAPNGDDKILHIADVYKSYGSKLVLDNIDLSVSKGELCSVVGPSGCGKSTLLRIVLGQEKQTSGIVKLDGRELGYPDPTRGIVYQRYTLYQHLTVIENVLLGKRLSSSWPEWRRRRNEFRDEAVELLAQMRLQNDLEKYPHELSGGMQQRVAIAQALIMRPKILMMDEPFGALDPGTREDMQLYLLELWERYSMTIFFVTHDLEEAIYLGTRVIVLSQYYSDDRGHADGVVRGAKIVADYGLGREARSTLVKRRVEFADLIQQIKAEGFEPEYRRHVKDFNLKHADSWHTLTHEEHREV